MTDFSNLTHLKDAVLLKEKAAEAYEKAVIACGQAREAHRPIHADIKQNMKFERGEWCHMVEHTITDGKISVSGTNPIADFARACLEAGYDKKRDLVIKRRKTILFTPATLEYWAAQNPKRKTNNG